MQAADLSCIDIDPTVIPQALKDRAQWVLWRAEFSPQKSKYTKVPLNPRTLGFASTNRPATWAPFDVALASLREAAAAGNAHGLGFVFTAEDPFAGVDLDHCVEHGVLNDLARAVVRDLASYAEFSPSGTGVHVIVEATLPGPGLHRPEIEIYDRGRYFTVSGRPIGAPLPVSRAQSTLEALYREHAGDAELASPGTDRSPPPSCPPGTPLPAWPSAITEALVQRGEGLADYGGDHSRACFATARTLLERGWSPAQVLHVLTDPDNYLAQNGGLKRRGTVEGARAWTWQYVVQPALASVQPTDLSLFTPITHDQAAVADISASPGASTPPDPDLPPGHNPTNPLRLHPLSAFAGDPIPEREWVWQDYLPRQEVTALYGSGGLGKSFLSLQLATAIATGTPFLGFDVAKGPVLGLYCEDDLFEIRRRLHSIHRSNIPQFGFDITAFEATLTELFVSSRRGLPNELATFTPAGIIQPTPLYHALLDHAKTLRPALIVLDSLYDLFLGDANEQSPVRQFMGLLTALADRSGAAVLLLAHPSKSGEATGRGDSGSVAWHAAVRSRLYLAQPTELEERRQFPNRRLLSRKKGNYSSDPSEGEMLLESRDGPFTVISLGAPGSSHPAYESHATEIDLLVEAVRTAERDGRRLSPDPRAADFVVNDAIGLAGLRHGVHATSKDRLRTALSIALAAKFLTRVTSTHPDTGKARSALSIGTDPSVPRSTSGTVDPFGEVTVEDWEL